MYPPPPNPSYNPNRNPAPKQSSDTADRRPCAACKQHRRGCPPDCIFAPYFPADQPERFARAHRLFGSSNISRCLRSLPDPDDREDAARAIVYESDARFHDPVGGAPNVLRRLLFLYHATRDELRFVQRLIQHVKDHNRVAAPPRSDPPN